MTNGGGTPEFESAPIDWEAEFAGSKDDFQNNPGLDAANISHEPGTAVLPPQNPNTLGTPDADDYTVGPPQPAPVPTPKPRPPAQPPVPKPAPRPQPPQPTSQPQPRPAPQQPNTPPPAPNPAQPNTAPAQTPTAPQPANTPPAQPAVGLFENFTFTPEIPDWDPASDTKPTRQQVNQIKAGLKELGSNLHDDVGGFAEATIKTENGKVTLYDEDTLQNVLAINLAPNDTASIDQAAQHMLNLVRQKHQLTDQQAHDALIALKSDIEHIAQKEHDFNQNGGSYKAELFNNIAGYRGIQEDLAQAKEARGPSLKEKLGKVRFKPGLIKTTRELRDKKEQLAYIGRAYGANVKKLAAIESATDPNGNPLPFSYNHKDIIDLLKNEKTSGGKEYTLGDLTTWLSSRSGGQAVGATEVANNLKNDLERFRNRLRKYDSDGLDKVLADVDKYNILKAEIKTDQDKYKQEYGRIGSTALAGMKVLWGGGATVAYATKKLVVNPHSAANIEKIQKYAPWAKIGALVLPTAVAVTGTILAARHGNGLNPLEFIGQMFDGGGNNNSDTSQADTGDLVVGRTGGFRGPEAHDLNIKPEDTLTGDYTETQEVGEWTGELNEQTGLQSGTIYDSVATEAANHGVDVSGLMENEEFRTELHNLVGDTLEHNNMSWQDAESVSNDFKADIPNDKLGEFLEKWSTQETTSETDSDNPPLSVDTESGGDSTDSTTAETGQNQAADGAELNGNDQQETGFDAAIKEILQLVPGIEPAVVSNFKDLLISNPNMLSQAYAGTAVSPQDALAYANIHNSLMVPALDYGYAQFIENMHHLLQDFISEEA